MPLTWTFSFVPSTSNTKFPRRFLLSASHKGCLLHAGFPSSAFKSSPSFKSHPKEPWLYENFWHWNVCSLLSVYPMLLWPVPFLLVLLLDNSNNEHLLSAKYVVFPVVMYGWESWTVKKVERRRIDAFELRCWRRLLRVPWTARRSNQSILKEISPGISLERMMLKLKLQYFGHLMRRVDSLEKTLMLGGIGGRRRRGRQRMRWLDGITDSMDVSWVNSGSWWWTGRPGVLRFMGSQRVGHDWATELNWNMCQALYQLEAIWPIGRSPRLQSQTARAGILILLLISSVTLGVFFNLFVPHFFHL